MLYHTLVARAHNRRILSGDPKEHVLDEMRRHLSVLSGEMGDLLHSPTRFANGEVVKATPLASHRLRRMLYSNFG